MSIRKKIQDIRARRRAIRELNMLDDHSLADIGISRAQIRTVVHGGR
ncbi:DUF1127 domain-containing protein [Mycoplana dimorpha]|uniref:Uncharacterized protein DUF1127 n=1 Tax=Mycoplana dimorpha TaxID=28320 RepID=A0A2T5BDY5_MYCDI|nr:DUF1127 domain-containing protein [Mycoplana dimorpha]PTM97171.1 uncharacterized protein DUF1127 [Mycoplana dimorpha]